MRDLSGLDSITGSLYVGHGSNSLTNIPSGNNNITVGNSTLTTNTTGYNVWSSNIAIGVNALHNITTLSNNNAISDSVL